RVVHRPGQQAGEYQGGLVSGRIARIAPGAVLHAARAFAGEPVRIGAAQPRVLHRLVRIDRDPAPGRRLHHALVVVHHVLAFVPGEDEVAVGVAHLGLARVGDVAG